LIGSYRSILLFLYFSRKNIMYNYLFMKQTLFTVLLISIVLGATAQNTRSQSQSATKKPTNTSAQPNQQLALMNLADSASYAIGLTIAQSLTQDFKELNKEAFLSAIKATFDNKTPLFSVDDSRSILMEFSKIEEEKATSAFLEKNQAFLEKNKSNSNVKVTESGLQYEILKEGSGDKPAITDTVVCNYIGMLIDSTEFDNSYERGTPLTIPLGGGIIAGWSEGLQLMSVGSKYRFYIPHELAYGLRGAPPTIPGGSTLIFEIELLEVKKGK